MAYQGYILMNLYKDAENDIIDDLKNENKYLKQKIKEYKHREEDLEDELSDRSHESKWLNNEIEKVYDESRKSWKKKMTDFINLKEIENCMKKTS